MQADKIISFREIDQFIDENIPSNSYVNNYYGHKELEKFYDNEILIRKARTFSPILALPLFRLFLSHFISKSFNGNSSNQNTTKSNKQQSASSKNKKRSSKTTGILIGTLMSGLYCCFFKPVSKIKN